MRKAGGILTIIGGCFGIGVGALLATMGQVASALTGMMWFTGIGPGLIGIGIVALIGGIYAMKGRVWGFSLAGAILAIVCGGPFGVLGTIFIALRKRDFS